MTDGGGEADHDIRLLKEHVGEMANLAIGMVADGTRVLLNADRDLQKSVTARDAPLDRYDVNVEAEAIRLVAIHQPEGRDLRTLEAILKIANCVDRIGRLGYDLSLNLSPVPLPTSETHDLIAKMDERSRAMVGQSIHALLTDDAAEAKAVFQMDDEVDDLYRKLRVRLVELLRAGGPTTDRYAFELLASRHLERVADNACKIAEKVVYAVTGERRSEYFPPRATS